MDHLPYPENHVVPPIRIPLLCTSDDIADRYSICTFPSQKGWNVTSQSALTPPDEEVALWIQGWLYLGLLRALLRKKFDLADFTTFDAQEKTSSINTSSLTRLIDEIRWEKAEFALLRWVTDRGHWFASRLTEAHTVSFTVLLSLQVLCESLKHISYVKTRYNFSHRRDYSSRIWPINRLLRQRMIRSKWCPYHAARISSKHSATSLYYLSGIKLPRWDATHEGCTDKVCVLDNVDLKTYTTRHVDSDCNCQFVGPDQVELGNIIKRGQIPLIQIPDDLDKKPDLKLIVAGFDTPYTAISHVWSDGLGNPRSNKLPLCQIKKLRTLLQRRKRDLIREEENRHFLSLPSWLRSPRHDALLRFWIDTLCVPRGETDELLSLRAKAIRRMDLVFSGAQEVMVLDRSLQQMAMNDNDLTLAATMAASPWLTRCWTFQESSLANTCVLALRDDVVELFSHYRSISTDYYLNRIDSKFFANMITNEFWNFIDERPSTALSQKEIYPTERLGAFYRAWNGLAERQSTRQEDVLLILTILLGLSPIEVMKLPMEQRLQAILRKQTSIPIGFLYHRYNHKSLTDGKCSWIPTYPTSYLSGRSEQLEWRANDGGLEFKLNKGTTVCFNLSSNFSTVPEFHFVDVLSNGTSQPVQVNVELKFQSRDSLFPKGRLVCILDDFNAPGPKYEDRGVGACFLTDHAGEVEEMVLCYCCPIRYYKTRPACSNSGDCSVDRAKSACYTAVRIKPNTNFILDCDAHLWPRLSYQRPMAVHLQQGLWQPISQSIAVVWSVATIMVGRLIPKNSRWYTVYTYPYFFVWMMFVIRFGFMGLLEMEELSQMTELIRHQRFVQTFDTDQDDQTVNQKPLSSPIDNPTNNGPGVTFGVSRQRSKVLPRYGSYQYNPWWTAGIPVAISFLLFRIAGKDFSPFSSATAGVKTSTTDLKKIVKISGQALLAETIIRLTGEFVCRRWGFTAWWLERLFPDD